MRRCQHHIIYSSLKSILHHHFYKFPDDRVQKISGLQPQYFGGRNWKQLKHKSKPEAEIFKPRVEKRYCKFHLSLIYDKIFLCAGAD